MYQAWNANEAKVINIKSSMPATDKANGLLTEAFYIKLNSGTFKAIQLQLPGFSRTKTIFHHFPYLDR